MSLELIAQWQDCPLASPPFVLPGDSEVVDASAFTAFRHPDYSYTEFVESPAFASPGIRHHLGLIPIPYVGDIQRAVIYVLLLNPGFSPDDYFGEERVP